MIDIKIKYEAMVFINATDIVPTPDIVSSLITLFRDKELIPYMSHQEIRVVEGGVPQQVRIKLSDPTNEWSISFTESRIDIDQQANDPKGTNLGEIEAFSETASIFFERIMTKFNKRASRLGMNSNGLLQEMTEDTLNQAYYTLFNPPEFYKTNKPFEWNWRSASRIPINIGDLDDTLNVITNLRRIRGELKSPQETTSLDRLNLLLDLNTSDLNSEPRFDSTHVDAFLKGIVDTHKSLVKELEDYIHA